MRNDKLRKACDEKSVPDKKNLLAFNRVVGDKIHAVNQRPGKKALSIIASKICARYPDTFKDFVPGFGTLGDGTTSVLQRLVNYIDSKNRTGANSLRRRLYSKPEEEGGEERGKKRKASSAFLKDSYRCIMWQPDGFPEGETEGSQETNRLWLLEEYSRDHQDDIKVKKLWKVTYASQRFAINNKGSVINQVIKDWPHFKQPNLMLAHFEVLMGFELLERLDEQYTQKCSDLLNFAAEIMGNKKAGEVAAQLQSLTNEFQCEGPVLAGVLWLVPFLVDEDQEKLFKLSDVSSLF